MFLHFFLFGFCLFFFFITPAYSFIVFIFINVIFYSLFLSFLPSDLFHLLIDISFLILLFCFFFFLLILLHFLFTFSYFRLFLLYIAFFFYCNLLLLHISYFFQSVFLLLLLPLFYLSLLLNSFAITFYPRLFFLSLALIYVFAFFPPSPSLSPRKARKLLAFPCLIRLGVYNKRSYTFAVISPFDSNRQRFLPLLSRLLIHHHCSPTRPDNLYV
ncbi:unnamed protein product [Acanthosepion pharaonis]|uniref:Uncharacterized protein n=1 Tax=Acanthosepion pharaonis TaxID=158019 RepID=A0A812DA74_ACAPH|nr:unnamed protein product [Sepia pharaonis]